MRIINRWFLPSSALVLLLGMMVSGGPRVLAQDAPADGAFPIGIHSGTCADPTTEPAYDGGLAEPVQETGETEAVDLEEEEEEEAPPPAGDAGAPAAEAPVEEEDDRAERGREQAARIGETVYKADTELEDVDMAALIEQPHVVIVHESEENYGTYLACGRIDPLAEEGQIVVLLRPVGDSETIGVSLILDDGSEAATFVRRGIQDPDVAAATPEA